MGRNLLANGRGRWLAVAGLLIVSAGMFYVQATEAPCCAQPPAAASAAERAAPAAAPYVASPQEAELMAASAPSVPLAVPFTLPPGVAPENGLQIHTIRAARAISVMFPEITTIGGYRQDALKWHPMGLAIDVMIPNHDSEQGIELGNQIAGYALANAKRWGVVNVIWRHAIYMGPDAGQWMAEMGSETANHFDHVHIATDGGGYPTGKETYTI